MSKAVADSDSAVVPPISDDAVGQLLRVLSGPVPCRAALGCAHPRGCWTERDPRDHGSSVSDGIWLRGDTLVKWIA